nr:reverse transcriptase domain-containing protein [Tanacetum cinerariifolium]
MKHIWGDKAAGKGVLSRGGKFGYSGVQYTSLNWKGRLSFDILHFWSLWLLWTINESPSGLKVLQINRKDPPRNDLQLQQRSYNDCSKRRDVYFLDMASSAQESCFFAKASENLNWLWHKSLAHLNFKTINKLAKQNLVIRLPSLVCSKDKPCSSCEKGKHHRASFKTKQTSSIKKCLRLLHMDLFGPVYFLKKKSQAPETIMSFIKIVENQNDIKVKQLRTDNVYIHNDKDYLGMFDEKTDDGYLLGYSLDSKAFRFFNTRRRQTKETYHVTFDESPDAIKFSQSSVDNINIAETKRYPSDNIFILMNLLKEDTSVHNTITIPILPLPNSLMVNPAPQNTWPKDKHIEQIFFLKNKVFEALKHPGWVDAIQEELNQFARNKVWILVPAPYGKTIIGLKWVLKNKRDETGIVIKNKARLVAQGYNQQVGIDYDETFSPVARLKVLKISLLLIRHCLPSSDEWSSLGFQSWIETNLREDGGRNHTSWSDKLDDALWAFRTAYKTPITCTPYKLVYGKSCHLPIELEHRDYWALKHVNFDLKTAGDHRMLQLNELSELRDQAYENYVIYKERMKKLHDSKIKNRIFNVGDQVLLFNSRPKIFSGKLKTRWSGPFTITRVFRYGTIELSQPNGPNFKVNGHRGKHYFSGDVPSNVTSDLHTFLMDN